MYTIRYLVSLGLAIAACSLGYTIIIMWRITEFIPLEGKPYWVVGGILYLIIVTLGLRFYIPRMRNIW